MAPKNQDKKRIQVALRRVLNQMKVRKQKKVFAIGFNKSASTSLHYLFESLGRPSYHGVKWREHDDLDFLRTYDCFSDGIPRDLPELDGMFPGSKFILNIRDLRDWVHSRLAHIEREKKDGTFQGGPAWDNTEEAITHWIKQRNEYHLFVLSYFSKRKNDLLVVNFIRDELAADKVSAFLGYKGKINKPKQNVNPSKELPQRHTDMLMRCAKSLEISECELGYDTYCPSLENKETQDQFPHDSDLLNKTHD